MSLTEAWTTQLKPLRPNREQLTSSVQLSNYEVGQNLKTNSFSSLETDETCGKILRNLNFEEEQYESVALLSGRLPPLPDHWFWGSSQWGEQGHER